MSARGHLLAASDTTIGDYAAIGDCRTVALVSRFGSIDWCCLPDFSSPSVFAALLDRERGGCFSMAPLGLATGSQQYLPRSNVVLTRMQCEHGELELTDFMPFGAHRSSQDIVRIARCTAGRVELSVRFEPRPDYARMCPALQRLRERQWDCAAAAAAMQLRSSFDLQGDGQTLAGVVPMAQGEVHAAILSAGPAPLRSDPPLEAAQRELSATLEAWREWCGHCSYEGDHADEVLRSALALKLLTHRATGALVAAATTSIPESETGARNWDYRFCWLRDSSLVFDAFTQLGYPDESGAFLRWLLHATHRTRPRLQVVYDVYGGHHLEEQVLPNLRGYRGIGPVHIGNAAAGQQQNDVYGEVLVTAADYVQCGGRLDHGEKKLVATFAHMACEVWREPDNGIWEIRSAPRHNTHSKLMCWAGLDRVLRIHAAHPLPIDAERVRSERDAIRADIEAHAWDAKLQSYVGFYGSTAPDASLLLMPRMGYVDARDPRMVGTTQCILRELSDGGLLYRYPPGTGYDGVAGGEHLFAICSFWCVDCLARQGRIDEAQALYERLLSLRNPAGLYAEEFAADTGRPIGNFPQAFSHVGSITAALSLRAARTASRQGSRQGSQ